MSSKDAVKDAVKDTDMPQTDAEKANGAYADGPAAQDSPRVVHGFSVRSNYSNFGDVN